jgi:hypothetical protein
LQCQLYQLLSSLSSLAEIDGEVKMRGTVVRVNLGAMGAGAMVGATAGGVLVVA